jgi:hypothetical protein
MKIVVYIRISTARRESDIRIFAKKTIPGLPGVFCGFPTAPIDQMACLRPWLRIGRPRFTPA